MVKEMKQEQMIKIIKREDRDQLKKNKKRNKKRTDPARELLNNVTDWVREFQNREQVDPLRAFQSLFDETDAHLSEI
jgi:uncharacterized membrane-anchored protein